MKNLIGILIVLLFSIGCSSTKELRKSEKEEKQMDKEIGSLSHHLYKELKSQNYEFCGLGDMESEIENYLHAKTIQGSICEEARVTSPTENLGKKKCISNIKSRITQIVCDSIRYRVDEATGGDETNRGDYVDKFFSAAEHLGILNLGSPDYMFIISKKINRHNTEYRMFAVYSPQSINNVVSNGVRFGNDIKSYIDKGLNK